MNQPSTCIDDELLREKIKAVLADPNLRLRMTKASPLEEWSVTVEVNLNPQPMVSLEEMEARGDKILIFHCAKKPEQPLSAGSALAGAGDAGVYPVHGVANGGDDGIAKNVPDLPLIGAGLDGFAGLKLDVELAGAGADDGDGELDHITQPTTTGEPKAS